MNMAQVAFDTLAYANKLKAAGVDPKIAETQAEVQVQILNDLTKNQLATKDDMHNLERRIDRVQLATKEDIRGLENKIDTAQLETKENIHNLDKRIDKVEQRVNGLKNELTVRLGGIVIGSSAVLGALMTILSHVK